MDRIEQNKLIQIALYVLNKTGGIDYYHLFKILYFAERKHLAKWGCGMLPDKFHALKYGPVPTKLYDAVKHKDAAGTSLSELLFECAEFAGDDAPNVLVPKCQPDMDYLSDSAIEVLDESIKENEGLVFSQLKLKSHDLAWQKAHSSHDKVISPISMAKAENASNAIIDFISEQMEIDKMLEAY